jgi:hypothetical protein
VSCSSKPTSAPNNNTAGNALAEDIISEDFIEEKYLAGDIISEDFVEEKYLAEDRLEEFFLEENEIIEDQISETLLKEKTIKEIEYIEIIYVPHEQIYSYFDNDIVSDEFGSRININAVLTKVAAGSGVLIIAAGLQVVGVPSTVVIRGIYGAGIGAGLGAAIGGLNGLLSGIDKSGRAAVSVDLALSIAGFVIFAIGLATALPTGGASLVLAGVVLAAATGGVAYSAKECVKTFQATDSFGVDWDNIDWEAARYSVAANAIDGAATGFMIGAIVGTTQGAARAIDDAKFRNTVPKNLLELTDSQKAYLKQQGFTDKQISRMAYNKDTGRVYYKTIQASKAGTIVETEKGPVKYVRRTVKLKDVEVEMVVADFKPYVKFQWKLKPDEYQAKDYAVKANKGLKDAIVKDPTLKELFTQEQLADIAAGKTPTGFQWNHSEEEGILELISSEAHDVAKGGAAHQGGNSLWGYNQ